jgi:hypothetical protein
LVSLRVRMSDETRGRERKAAHFRIPVMQPVTMTTRRESFPPPDASMRTTSSTFHRVLVTGGMVLGAAMVAWSGAIHLHLWMGGYRNIHIIGPLFLAQAITAFVIALVVVALRWATSALVGALFLASTIAGLVISGWHGLFGFRDSLTAPFATLSLVVEGAGIFVLASSGAGRYLLRRASRR